MRSAPAWSSCKRRTGIELAGINAEECQLTDERIGHDLEHQRGKRLFVVRLAGSRGSAIRRPALNRRNIDRRRQKFTTASSSG
jgi:hypothetical protein